MGDEGGVLVGPVLSANHTLLSLDLSGNMLLAQVIDCTLFHCFVRASMGLMVSFTSGGDVHLSRLVGEHNVDLFEVRQIFSVVFHVYNNLHLPAYPRTTSMCQRRRR